MMVLAEAMAIRTRITKGGTMCACIMFLDTTLIKRNLLCQLHWRIVFRRWRSGVLSGHPVSRERCERKLVIVD
jgi:hypothetical protein